MGKYNAYGTLVINAFDDAHAAWKNAVEKLHTAERFAEKKREEARNIADKIMANDTEQAARDQYRTDARTISADLNAALDKLRADFRGKVAEEYTIDPGRIEPEVVEIMKTGIMKAADFESMAKRYENNETMRRMVAMYAGKYAETVSDPEERARLSRLQGVDGEAETLIRDYETILNSVRIFSGFYHGDFNAESIGYIAKMHENFDAELRDTLRSM